MKHIKKFNETKKDEKVKDQEVLFNAEVLVDKDEKPSFKTGEQEDQEKFEAFIDVDIHIDNIDEVEIENEYDTEGHDEESEEEVQQVGCGCCDECTGQSDCECCSDCSCDESGEEHTMNQPKVMNLSDFMNSIAGQ